MASVGIQMVDKEKLQAMPVAVVGAPVFVVCKPCNLNIRVPDGQHKVQCGNCASWHTVPGSAGAIAAGKTGLDVLLPVQGLQIRQSFEVSATVLLRASRCCCTRALSSHCVPRTAVGAPRVHQ
jgi:hypothetical protein